jgi:exopolyphosphatase/guanosine-5'-triphosphate,3'-diphosphate pyrophosphatase
MPAVIKNGPLLFDGTPMPTRFWLVDPALRDAVSRLEAAGGVRHAAGRVSQDEVADAHARYAVERDAALPHGHTGPAPSGGVGGTRRGVKCLHAHLAWYLCGGDDPVGRWTAEQLGVSLSDFVVEDEGVELPARPVAAIDCGTNSTRLIAVDADGTVLRREMRITRLGAGVDATRRLSSASIDRTLAVLRDYRRAMDDLGVVRRRVVATSAARDAVNAEEFMAGAAEITGVRPDLLSGDDEGRLSFAGATARLPPGSAGTSPVLVADIGGGSTELAVGCARGSGDTQVPEVRTRSLDIGCVRVSERWLPDDPPPPEQLARARDEVREQLVAARSDLPTLAPDSLFVGLAGTVSAVASLEGAIAVYDRERIHHARLARADVERWLRILSAEDARARLDHPGMVRGREDVIVGGVLILAVVMECFGRDRCLVSEDDILDGLAAELLASGRALD